MHQLLKTHFGYDEFRPLQAEIIKNVLASEDTFVLMPTGGGKSMCYQLPALKFVGLTIVISPLIALMKDQVDALQSNGIKAEFINSSLSASKINEIEQGILNERIKILYIAPERLNAESFQFLFKKLQNSYIIHQEQKYPAVSLIAIDEAHCISEWGHDFRPDYRNLKNLKTWFPHTPLIALTATATAKVQVDILQQLNMEHAKTFISSFDRDNLHIQVIPKKQAYTKMVQILRKYQGESGIIYCFSRKDTENIATDLKQEGFSVLPYHAGLSVEQRKKTQEAFIKDEINIIVATIAFGMGIDKPDVRLVIHHTFPKTVESYYQEIGRAGRDYLPSECVLFYSWADKMKHEFFHHNITDPQEKIRAKQKLAEMINYCELQTCRRQYLLQYFGENYPKTNCSGCDICLKENTNIVDENNHKLNFNQNLFQELRQLRKQIAANKSVPPFVVFGDVSLQEMAFYMPVNLESFANITGVGSQKLANFCPDFVRLIKNYVEQNKLIPKIFSNSDKSKIIKKQNLGQGHQITKSMIQEKKTLAEIAKTQGVKEATIVNHLEKIIDTGVSLDLDYLKLAVANFAIIAQAFEQCGYEKLKPVFDLLAEKYSYDEIRIVRILLKNKTIK